MELNNHELKALNTSYLIVSQILAEKIVELQNIPFEAFQEKMGNFERRNNLRNWIQKLVTAKEAISVLMEP